MDRDEIAAKAAALRGRRFELEREQKATDKAIKLYNTVKPPGEPNELELVMRDRALALLADRFAVAEGMSALRPYFDFDLDTDPPDQASN